MGGALAAIEKGYMQSEIQKAAYRYQRAIETKEQVVVGVNQYQIKEELTLERHAGRPFHRAKPARPPGRAAQLVAIRRKPPS